MTRRLPSCRSLADLLTVSRVLLALCITWLGISAGARALPAVMLIVILSWLTDLLDGPLARRDSTSPVSWVGRHDAEADLTTSLGVVAYLVLSGTMAGWVGALIGLATLALWGLYSRQLAWPLYATPYGVLVFAAFRAAPAFGWLTVTYLMVTAVTRWPRLRREYLPEFVRVVGDLLQRGAH